jgi:hypothetical protein
MNEQPCSIVEAAQFDWDWPGNHRTIVVHPAQLRLPSEGPLAEAGFHCLGRNVNPADINHFGSNCCRWG